MEILWHRFVSSVLFSVDYFIVQLQITDMLHFNFFTGIKSEN